MTRKLHNALCLYGGDILLNPLFCFPYMTLPSVFVEGYSYAEQICLIVQKYNELIKVVNQHSEDIPKIYDLCKDLQKQIDALEKEVDGLLDGTVIINLIKQKIDEVIKMVFFGLTDDGYFVAYIPSSWNDIQFGTIMDCESPDFGKLTLAY